MVEIMKETATENIKLKPSTKRRLNALGKMTYDEIVVFLLDFYEGKLVEDLEKRGKI
jgi:hypothetical protein